MVGDPFNNPYGSTFGMEPWVPIPCRRMLFEEEGVVGYCMGIRRAWVDGVLGCLSWLGCPPTGLSNRYDWIGRVAPLVMPVPPHGVGGDLGDLHKNTDGYQSPVGWWG